MATPYLTSELFADQNSDNALNELIAVDAIDSILRMPKDQQRKILEELFQYQQDYLDLQRQQDELKVNAERWQALVGCGRVRALGSAGLTKDIDTYGQPYGDYAHLGLELWTVHPAGSESTALNLLTQFADKAVICMHKKDHAQLPDNQVTPESEREQAPSQ